MVIPDFGILENMFSGFSLALKSGTKFYNLFFFFITDFISIKIFIVIVTKEFRITLCGFHMCPNFANCLSPLSLYLILVLATVILMHILISNISCEKMQNQQQLMKVAD